MTERTYSLHVDKEHSRMTITAKQAERIGIQCADICIRAAKEATTSKANDVGKTRNGNIAVYNLSHWRHGDGVLVAPEDCPTKSLFNIKDVLEQGQVVIGTSVMDADFMLINWELVTDTGLRFKAKLEAALNNITAG